MTQLAVNTQIHPATFGGIANRDYIREFIYAQGFFGSDFCPLTHLGMQGFYHISLFSQPDMRKRVLTDSYLQNKSFRRHYDHTAGNNERQT
jgi:hypothetical protein